MPRPTAISPFRLPGQPGRLAIGLIAAANVLVLLTALAPFVLWETVGPARFDDLQLGDRPGSLSAAEPVEDAVDEVAGDAGPWMPEILLDLGPAVSVTLVFSVGSRGLDDAEADRLRVVDLDERGGDGLADTIMLLVADADSGQAALLSIPRDLWLPHRGHRINASFNFHGVSGLVDDVSRVSGLPVHHVVRLNFAAFAELVDAVGGVDLTVDRALADVHSMLYVPEAGCWHFEGPDALGYVRSRRTLTRTGDGTWVTDPTASDFGRITRQQQVLGALWDRIRGPSVVTRLPALLGAARDGLVVDRGLGVQEVRDLGQAFGEIAAGRVEGFTLPTRPRRIGAASVLVLDESEARPILTRLRQWPPASESVESFGRATTVLAMGPMALPDHGCDSTTARRLPDPFGPLSVIAAGRDPTAPNDAPQPSRSPSPSPSQSRTDGPGPDESSTPSEGPSEPSEAPGGPLDLPTLP